MDKKELSFILKEGEGFTIEFKENVKNIDKEIVAFANGAGGRIFLGVDDNGKIKGIKVTNELRSQIQDIANNCDPPIEVDLNWFEDIIIIYVKEGKNKPYKCKDGFFMRIGPNSQKMSRDNILNVAIDEGKIRFDEQVNKEFNFKRDFDEEKFKLFLKENDLFTDLGIKDVLVSLGLASKEGKKLLLNNAAILFFAKKPQDFFLDAYLDCVLFKGKDKSEVIDRKKFSSSLLDQLSSAKKFVKEHLNLSYEFKEFEREEKYEIPLRAVEEALVNALMHRDYFFKGSNINLFIYSDRLEVISPGGLPKGLDKKNFGRLSVRRNRIIADIFSKTPYVEKIGSGIKRMKSLLKKAGLPSPKFEMNGLFIVTFKRKKPLIEPLSEPLKMIILFIRNNRAANRKKIADSLAISRATATRHLSALRKKGLIQYVGSKKRGHYVIKPPNNSKKGGKDV